MAAVTALPDPEVAGRLGRGVIVAADAPAPEPWTGAPRILIDDATLHAPVDACDALHAHWSRREPVVVELRCDANELRRPDSENAPPYTLSPRFEFAKERLYFLARANNYDNRDGRMVWGAGVEAQRLGATEHAAADVALLDGRPAWCDGGPRAHSLQLPDGHTLVHRNTIEQGLLTPDRDATTTAELAADQLDAVMHDAGAARVIAPAGSGKTRVLTERLRLLVARNWTPQSITAVAYNVRAKDTMPRPARRPARTGDRPHPHTALPRQRQSCAAPTATAR